MKWSQIKRALSLMLCILMVLALLPTSTLAEDTPTTPEATAAPAATPAETATSAPTAAATETETATSTPTATPTASVTETAAPDVSDTPDPAEETAPTPSADAQDAEETPLPSESPAEELPEATPATYVVNFVINGVTDVRLQQTVEEGGTVSAPHNPAVPDGEEFEGQVFLYWYARSNEAYNFSTPVTGNLVLYAQFGTTDEAPDVEEEPIVADEEILMSAFSMEGGILPDTTPLWTYTFVVNGSTVDTKVVADGDTLDEPAMPEAPEGQTFVGWYTAADTLFDSFGVQTVTEDGATTLTAKFETAYYVFFHNQFGSVIETRTPDASNVVSTANVTTLQLASNEALMGWSLTSGGTTDVGSSVTVDGANIDLYPIIENVIWITFDSAGGTYVAPMHIVPGTALTQAAVTAHIQDETGLSTIEKAGYTFSSWSGFTFGNTPTENVALTANWTANTVGYTVLFWQQAVVGDSYAVVASDTVTSRTALSGSTVSPISADTSKTYKGFNYNATKSVSVTVKGDGSTILNVYYDRQIWTVNFLLRSRTSSYTYNNNNNYTVWNTITGRYGSKLNYWPGASEADSYYSGGTGAYDFTNWMINASYNGTYLTYLEIYDDGGSTLFNSGVLNLYGIYQYNASLSYTINHYRQNLDGSWPSSPSQVAYAYSSGSFLINNRFEGFTAYLYQRDGGSWNSVVPGSTSVSNINNTLNIRHTRNSYNLTVYNFNVLLNTTSVLYENPLGSYQPGQPSRPSGIPSDYVWAGWYTTEQGYAGSEMDWAQTMPAHDLIVYGVWKAPTFTGIAHSVSYGSTGGTTVDLGAIEYGGTINSSALANAQTAAEADKPNPTDTFGGWLILKNGSLVLFNSSMQIYENVVLYPIWISTLNYSITYSLGEASGTAPTDGNTYAPGSQAEVKAYAALLVTPPADKVFIGWRSSVDSKIYYPKSAITITANTTLTAVWVYSSVYVTITYNGNGGATSGGATTFTGGAVNNTYHTVQGNSFLYTGKVFVGWNTSSAGTGDWYSPGDSVLLGISVPGAPGTLFAIWEDETFDVSVTATPAAGVTAKSGAGTYDYGTDATVTWTLASGYELTSVTDNGTLVPAASYAGNSYAITGITEDHDIVINTQMTLFTLTYDGNGGTVGGDATYSMTKTTGTSFTVDANTFTRDGYYFLGWSTTTGATVADPAYAPGASVTMPSADLTLYAVWAAKTALTLTANSATVNYDGTLKSVSGITPSIAGLIVSGTTAGASGTEPGVYATSFTNQAGLVLTSDDQDVTERYAVSWAGGALTVNPKVTYIVSATGAVIGTEWVAYGTGDATYNVTPPQSVTSGGINFYWTGAYNPATANDLTANMTITATYVQNKTLLITADSESYPYDGTQKSVTTAKLSDPTLHVSGYTVSGSGTNVGTYTTAVTLGTVVILSGTTDVTYQYDVSTATGLLTITPATATADSDGYTGKYDGQPHGITVDPDVDGSTVRYSLTNSTNPADYTLTTSPTATDYTTGLTVYFVVTNPNYNPVFGSETVTINK
ncbi:MAG: InlB B-repeat-containing protein, partial [Clostridiales bacterium]|nr:InlB B-repeat-containing protein [Clostridiales bacterium]